MDPSLQAKLKTLPAKPGIYFFRDATGKIIYIGKASVLKRRVTSYFQKKHRDVKTPILVSNIAAVDWIETDSEIEALFLEAEFIKRHKPLYNIELRDDKNFVYIKVALNEEYPYITLVRRPNDDKSKYFGPFVSGYQVKQALRYMRKIFPYYTKPRQANTSKLEYQIGVAPSPEMTPTVYRQGIQRLVLIFEGKTASLLKELEKEMKRLAKTKDYETAAGVRNQYMAIKSLDTKIVFGRDETFDLTLDNALLELTQILGLKQSPRRIECYDISNFAGGDAVSSMIVFTDGVPDQKEYRHFKMRTKGPNDFAMMAETLQRRFSVKNSKWSKPDLIIVDGGKGQLGAARQQLSTDGIVIPVVGLAKRYETIVQHIDDAVGKENSLSRREGEFILTNFESGSPLLHLLQRIRDEAHRFAVTYHTLIRKKRTSKSLLEEIPGIGPVTQRKIIRHFGSARAVTSASEADISALIGPKLTKRLLEQINKEPLVENRENPPKTSEK